MTNIVLSNLVAGIEPSPTEETSFLANTLKRQELMSLVSPKVNQTLIRPIILKRRQSRPLMRDLPSILMWAEL